MRRIIYISGGQRSGKSGFAQSMAESLSPTPTYLATAKCWDEEFAHRIELHKAARGDMWRNIEEPREIASLDLDGQVVLMDCITLWLTNIFDDCSYDLDRTLEEAKREWDRFIEKDFTLIVVSNEIGMGVISAERTTRAFIDLQGWMNQYVAASADEAYTMISGLSLKLK